MKMKIRLRHDFTHYFPNEKKNYKAGDIVEGWVNEHGTFFDDDPSGLCFLKEEYEIVDETQE